jgi:hypothetical protein
VFESCLQSTCRQGNLDFFHAVEQMVKWETTSYFLRSTVYSSVMSVWDTAPDAVVSPPVTRSRCFICRSRPRNPETRHTARRLPRTRPHQKQSSIRDLEGSSSRTIITPPAANLGSRCLRIQPLVPRPRDEAFLESYSLITFVYSFVCTPSPSAAHVDGRDDLPSRVTTALSRPTFC